MKAKITIAFTYEKVTPESAEQGDVSERGWYEPGGWFWVDDTPGACTRKDWKPGALKNAIESARGLGICEASENPLPIRNRHAWFSSVTADQDFRSGESTYYSLHVDGVTLATLNRIARVLSGRPIFSKEARR